MLHIAATVDVADEIKTTKKILLPEIVTLMNINQIPTQIMVMERYEESLHDYLKNFDWSNRDLSFIYPERKVIAQNIISSVRFLHSLYIVHLDLKPANFLIRHKNQNKIEAVLIDFGISQSLADVVPSDDLIEMSNLRDFESALRSNKINYVVSERVGAGTPRAGTPGFASPEQLLGRCSEKSDIYSLGKLLLFLMLPMNVCFYLFFEPHSTKNQIPHQEKLL